MPVSPTTLSSRLAANFANPGASAAACANQWAEAMGEYATLVAPPSSTLAQAKAALSNGLAGAFALPGGAIPGMELAFTAFAVALGGGMAGFVAAPSPSPVGFASQFAGPPPATHALAAAALATIIDAWFRRCTATAPGGSPINWS